MGFYKDGKYVYEQTDVGNGICSDETYQNQEREKQKNLIKIMPVRLAGIFQMKLRLLKEKPLTERAEKG